MLRTGASSAFQRQSIVAQTLPITNPLSAVPEWVWWTVGGIVLAIVVGYVVWYVLTGYHRRLASSIVAIIGVGGCVPKIAAWLDIPGIAQSGFFIDSAPSAAWPLALIAIVSLIIDYRQRNPSAPPAQGGAGTGDAKSTAALGGKAASNTGSGQVTVGDGNTQVRDQYTGGVHHHHASNDEVVKSLIAQSEKVGELTTQLAARTNQLAQSEEEKTKLAEQLAAALARVEALGERGAPPITISTGAAIHPAMGTSIFTIEIVNWVLGLFRWRRKGDPAARAALAEAREGKDPAKLQAVLIAERDRQETKIRDNAADWIELNREIAAVAYVRGDIDVATDALQKVLTLSKNDLDAINSLGHIHQLRGELPAAERQYGLLLELDATDEWRAIALGNLGLIAEMRGDLDGAEKLHREALEIERKLGRLEGQASDLGNLGIIAQTLGDLDAAEKLHREALEINRKLGRLEGQAIPLGNLGVIAKTRGDLDGAEKLHREALEIDRKLGSLGGQASDLGNLGLIAKTRGDLDGAEKLHREALEINRKLGSLGGQAIPLGNLGVIAQTRGDLDGAEKLYREALEINRKLGRLEGQAIQLGNLGNLAQTRGDLDGAEKLHREALEINRKLGRLEGQAIQLGNLGAVAEQRKDFTEARRLWKESRDLFAKIGMPHMQKKLQGWLDGPPSAE